MENPQDKLDWFGSERETGFLPELKNFATQHRYTFSPKDINQLKHTMQGMAAIKEGLFEGYYGTRKISYVGEQTEARLVIKHNRMIGEDDKRYRYVESLFIETVDGERFKLPFTKLSGGRAMLEHVKQGGRPYDIRGQHINEIVSEMAVLSRFNRASQQRVFEGVTQELVETVYHYYSELRENLQHMATGRGYAQYFESWTPADIGDETALVEDLKTMFIEQTLDARIEAALPTLAKIQQRGNAMKEAQIFENWVNGIMEGTWALPDTPEAQAKLDELMSKELIVGPDATNAKEQLYDVIGDDVLFDILADLAEQDPRANCWDDTDVQARLQELGIQLNTTPAADQQQPVAPAAGQQAPGTAPEQGMAEDQLDELSPATLSSYARRAKGQAGWAAGVATAAPGYKDQLTSRSGEVVRQQHIVPGSEADKYDKLAKRRYAGAKQAVGKGANVNPGNVEPYDWAKQGGYGDATNPAIRKRGMAENTELNAMLKYAGVPLRESVLTDSTGHTLEHILQRFSREVADFEKGADLDQDLFDALYDYYFDDMPYGVKKARTGDPYEWVSERLADELGIVESNSGMIMPEGNPIATVEAMTDLSAPVVEGSCNMTTEGEYCPEHGLAECGMYEMGTVAGSMAPVIGESPQDPINYNAAITGAYYESKSDTALLARIKSLALLK